MNISDIKRLIPASQWLSGYTLKLFGSDTLAGITLAAYAIPVSLAYATLAGLPPQYGVYGYLIGGIMEKTGKHIQHLHLIFLKKFIWGLLLLLMKQTILQRQCLEISERLNIN